MIPKVKEVCWLVKRKNKSLSVLGFLRDDSGGFFILGGDTGSHYSGHGENWQKKWDSYIGQDYLPKDLAVQKGIIKENWKPPSINKNDQEIITTIMNNLK